MFRLIPLIILLLSFNAFSQTIKVRAAKLGKAQIISGKASAVIDLSKDISGCLLIYDGTDPKLKKYDATGFNLLDSVRKNGAIYLVLVATSGGNCNVQGHCGATEDWTMIWLKLSNNLKVLDKKAVVVQSCHYGSIDLESIELDKNDVQKPPKLVNGKLKIGYSENQYREDRDYIFHTLTYKKAEAEKGFTVKTEKRERPKN